MIRPGTRRPDVLAIDSATRVLIALEGQYADGQRPTVRSVASAAGLSVGHAHLQLTFLRDAGLVGWTEGQRGSLHPLVVMAGATR